ncbi:putative ABC transport system permease protein [Pararhizobium capsulatum DSM 1112]|uniref:ABC transport system permease protein n=1 Tax=Pararhizobium capsulatum DSM 1112 TaxID=1121113 RepID=A0ABU0BIU1_9HYPH|nr:ABC transporter permease [Pararhizobium capsulatum]MDQ0318180.1 putative ABC transport system permease protein [Pararhizobium capsulatum DSM 1112]
MTGFILADLRRLWAGSLVVVLLIAFATALGVAVTLQERSLRLGSARAADHFDLVVGAPGSETQLVLSSVFLQASPLPLLPGATLAKLTYDPRVAWAAPVGLGDSFSGYPIVGTATVLISELSSIDEGRMFRTAGEAVVGAAVDLPMGYGVKPMHGSAYEGGETHTELSYSIVGRMKPTGTAWDKAILVPIQSVWALHGLGEHDQREGDHDAAHGEEEAAHAHAHVDPQSPVSENWDRDAPGLPAILVKPKSIADAYKLRQEYRGGGTLAVFPGEVLTALYTTLGDAKKVLSAVAIGAQVLVAAAVLLVTVVHIGQRRRQIGALRALGAPQSAVFSIVWLELFVLNAIGILLGFGIGYFAAKLLSALFAGQSGITLPVAFAQIDLVNAGAILLFAAILAVVPAVIAYRQSPAQALRS